MKCLLLGATGMLGHKVYQVFTNDKDIEIYGTIHGGMADLYHYDPLFHKKQNIIDHVDAKNILSVDHALNQVKPDVVINCIGIVKSLIEKKENRLDSIWVNSLFPHQLYQLCFNRGIKVIHISTDCVFRGATGSYKENYNPDARDLYGRTKYLGELNGDALTIRTSIIGRELSGQRNLVEWFLSHKDDAVQGFSKAYWNGFTTLELAYILLDLVLDYGDLIGTYHISSEVISKYRLLSMIKEAMGLKVDIVPSEDFKIDMTLDCSLFKDKTGFIAKPLIQQITEFAEDAQMYEKWR